MNDSSLRWKHLLVASACAAGASVTLAAPAADDVDSKMTTQLQSFLARSFVLGDDLVLDASLREQANSIASAHLARMQALLPEWIREERKLQGGDDTRVYFAVWARLLNELALWQITPGTAAYEAATLQAVTTAPLACRTGVQYRFTDYASRITRLQAMTNAQRADMLAGERELLARWGKPHGEVPAYPDPLPQVAGMQAVQRMRSGGTHPPVALMPVMTASLLAAPGTYADEPWEGKCLLQQWWLRVSLAQGMAPATALAAFRYGTMITADERIGDWFDGDGTRAAQPSAGTRTYPVMARRFGIEGRTTMTPVLDAAGKPAGVRVLVRKVDVPGIRGVRPVAFENVFDSVAVGSAAPTQGDYQLVWTLSPSTPAVKGVKP